MKVTVFRNDHKSNMLDKDKTKKRLERNNSTFAPKGHQDTYAEDFTPDCVLDMMCEGIKEVPDYTKSFYDPCAGDGNIYMYVLKKRLEHADFITCIRNMYATEILPDNVEDHKDRVLELAHENGADENAVRRIIDNNIACRDFINEEPLFIVDLIVQNPPYKRDTHITIMLKSWELCKKMVIVQPSKWLINLRDNGKASMYAELRKKLDKHAISVKIENLNHEFNIGNATPLAITTLSKAARPEGQKIEFTCCGETSYVDTLDDCNLIGPRKMVSQILEKVRQRAPKHMEDIVYDKDRDGSPEGAAYLKFTDVMVKTVFMLKLNGDTYDPEAIKKNAYFEHDEEHDAWYLQSVFEVGAYKGSVPTRDVPKKVATGGSKGGDAFCLMVSDYPDFESNARILENWKHFIYNSNLAHFICISTTYDLHNGSKRWLPWLDWTKKWTDNELREWFGIADSEWSLIESTCKKFRRDSEWFKRYMCGPSILSPNSCTGT